MSRPDPLDRIDRIALVACLAAGLAVRVLWIGRDDLWSDEVHTFRTMSLPVGDVVGERLSAGHVPLYFLLLRGWSALFGDSPEALRLPSALAGTALLFPAFSLLRRVVPGAAARWGLVLFALHPTLVELSREARMYSFLGLAFFVLADGAVAALDEARVPKRLWIAALVGPFVSPSWGFAAAPLALWTAWEARVLGRVDPAADAAAPARAHAGRRAAAWIAVSVVLLAVLLLGATPQHQELTRRPWPRELLVFLVRPFIGTDLRADLYGIGALALVAWATCLWRGSREDAPRALRFALAIGVGVPVASVASGAIGGVPWGPVRYVHLCAVGLVVAAALAARHSQRVIDRFRASGGGDVMGRLRADFIGVPWLAAALLVFLASRASHPRTLWSDAAREIAARVPPGETVFVDDDGSRVVLEHYLAATEHAAPPVPPVPPTPPLPPSHPDVPTHPVAVGRPAAAHWRVVPASPGSEHVGSADATRPWELVRTGP